MRGNLEDDARILSILSDQQSLLVIAVLAKNDDVCDCKLKEILGMDKYRFRDFMKPLIRARIVRTMSKDRCNYYELDRPQTDLLEILQRWLIKEVSEYEEVKEVSDKISELRCEAK